MRPQAKNAWGHLELEGGSKARPPLFQTSGLQNWERINVCRFKPVCTIFLGDYDV